MLGIKEQQVTNSEVLQMLGDFHCGVCGNIPLDPHTCFNCETNFCDGCLKHSGISSCKKCGFKNLKFFPKVLKNFLSQLRVKCENKNCGEVVSYCEIREHKALCFEISPEESSRANNSSFLKSFENVELEESNKLESFTQIANEESLVKEEQPEGENFMKITDSLFDNISQYKEDDEVDHKGDKISLLESRVDKLEKLCGELIYEITMLKESRDNYQKDPTLNLKAGSRPTAKNVLPSFGTKFVVDKCSGCEVIVNKNLKEKCHQCSMFLCEACLVTCAECKKSTCRKCAKCQLCKKTKECRDCRSPCKQCIKGEQVFCSSCTTTCNICKLLFCRRCAGFKCAKCSSVCCLACSWNCNICHNNFCSQAPCEFCNFCGAKNCQSDTESCCYCGKVTCMNCFNKCVDCNLSPCKRCTYKRKDSKPICKKCVYN